VSRLRRIAALALPIVGGMVSQNVLNLVDTAMVGTLGDDALAAVSTASFTNFMCIAFITGLSSGVQAMAARRKGEGRDAETARPLNEGLLLALLIGLPGCLVLIALAPTFYPLVNDDPDVVSQAVPYLRARLGAMVAVGMNFAFRGYWNGIDRSRLYMNTLLVMHASNIAISYGLIFGVGPLPELGAQGAGLGTALATWLGTAVYFWLGLRHARASGFLKVRPDLGNLATLLKLALPSSIQQFMFAAGFTALFTIIGRIGTTEVAAAGVLVNVSLVAILPGLALGLAAASLVGQALGRGDADDAARWGWDVVKVAVVFMSLLGLPMVVVPDMLLAPFLHDPATIAVARPALQVVGATLFLDGIGMVLMQALLGAGAARLVMVVSVGLQWGLMLPLSFVVGPVLGGTVVHIWLVQVLQRLIQAVVFAVVWQRGAWKTIRV
jgi:putative MATE family efflux protein